MQKLIISKIIFCTSKRLYQAALYLTLKTSHPTQDFVLQIRFFNSVTYLLLMYALCVYGHTLWAYPTHIMWAYPTHTGGLISPHHVGVKAHILNIMMLRLK